MSFLEAMKSVFSQYANFSGRARRSESWYFTLFNVTLSVIISPLAQASLIFYILICLVSLALFIPGLAVAVRRLHDIGKAGWNLFFLLIPLVGPIMLIIWYCKDSDPGINKYGSCPK